MNLWQWVDARPGLSLTVNRGEWRFSRRRSTLVSGTYQRALLWALALEIDERVATRTGEQVCRACGGLGGFYRWGRRPFLCSSTPCSARPIPGIPDLIAGNALRREMDTATAHDEGHKDSQRWAWRRTCPCDGPTRPGVIALHRLVETLADLPHPRFAWPDEWIVRADEIAEAGGWMATWWRVFAEWTLRGKEPDAEVLAPMLAALIPELEAREKAKRDARLIHVNTMLVPSTRSIHTPATYSIEEVREAMASMRRASLRDNLAVPFDPPYNMEPFREPPPEATFLDIIAKQFAEPVKASMTKAFEELAKLDDEPPDDAEPSPGPHPLTRRGRGRW